MQNDFGSGKIWKVIIAQSVPLLLAQLVHLLYNVVDRIYIGHLADIGAMALTGIGLAFPLTTLILAFTYLFASGGAPLFAIARGEGDEDKAQLILSQVTGCLVIASVILFGLCYVFRKPVLCALGASGASYVWADRYLKIYLWGTMAAMLGTGLNGFINAAGYPRIGMMTVVLGAALNLLLDPLFIFVFHMDVQGAALATVISQIVSAGWAVRFFMKDSSPYRIEKERMMPKMAVLKEILPLGFASFIMQGTNAAVQIVCNITLRQYGGDLFVGVMTVINSVREIASLPVQAVAQGAQPVMSFNFGAKKYSRIRQAIRMSTLMSFVYTAFAWAMVMIFPAPIMRIFTNDPQLIEAGTSSLKIYFFGFVFMAFQISGQHVFTALRCTKRAIFFSLFRKVIIVVPLTVLLPRLGYGVNGVFAAEPVSNVLGGSAAYVTMLLTVYRKLPADGETAYI